MIRKIVGLGAVLIVSCGCSVGVTKDDPLTGTGIGEIKLSVSAMATYERYTRKKYPEELVVTIDGERGFYAYCEPSRECPSDTYEKLLAVCSARSGKVCRIFASRGKVVWQAPGEWRNSNKIGMHFFIDHKGIRADKL